MIDYLLEIVFKKVKPEKIESFLRDLTLDGKNILNFNSPEKKIEIKWNEDKSIRNLFSKNKNLSIFFMLKEINMYDVILVNCGISVIKYGDADITVEIDFILSENVTYKKSELVKCLMKLSKGVSDCYLIPDYFCGIEPASDKNTRLFTREEIGPITLEE